MKLSRRDPFDYPEPDELTDAEIQQQQYAEVGRAYMALARAAADPDLTVSQYNDIKACLDEACEPLW